MEVAKGRVLRCRRFKKEAGSEVRTVVLDMAILHSVSFPVKQVLTKASSLVGLD